MTLASFIQAMPKVELSLQLEGAMPIKTLLNIAQRNEIPETVKGFKTWVGLIEKPDYKRIHEIAQVASSWLMFPDDLTRIVYDVGLSLVKQNVRYAEIGVSPALYQALNLSLDNWLNVINDGRDRVKRAWGLEIAWIIMIPRDDPRRADDLVRFASSPSGRRGGVVGVGLTGREDVMPVGQFEKAFQTARKRELHCAARAGDMNKLEGVLETIKVLAPDRLIDGRGLNESVDALRMLAQRELSVCVGISRAIKHGWIDHPSELGLQTMVDEGVVVTVGADMPAFYQSTLIDEYRILAESGAAHADVVEILALNAVRASFLPPDQKAALLDEFRIAYSNLREEHLSTEIA